MSMLRLLSLMLGLWVSSLSAQRIAMIDMKGHPDTLAYRLCHERGFIAQPNQGSVRVVTGILNGDAVAVHIYSTPINTRVWKAVVYHAPVKNFKKAAVDFEAKVAKLEARYGQYVEHFIDKKARKARADWGQMAFFQNLHLIAEIVNQNQVAVHFILRDEQMKYEEERLINGTPLF
jgi:hypothetical protein